jgi:peroxiredoxin
MRRQKVVKETFGKWRGILMRLALCVALIGAQSAHAQSEKLRVVAGQKAPEFHLPDIDGKARTLKEFRGQTLALYFFCGCFPCHQVGRSWSAIQRSGALKTNGKTPLSLVVVHGDEVTARAFASDTQLDMKNTVVLPDKKETVSGTYDADPCPRVFIVDPQGTIRYTNDEKGRDSHSIAPALITARATTNLRRVAGEKSKKK